LIAEVPLRYDYAGALPLLRWAGSKKRQFGKLRVFFPDQYANYVEPFAGSAAFFFGLGPRSARLNDLNSDVIDFYRNVRKDPEGFFHEFSSLIRSEANYYVIREQFNTLRKGRERSVLFYFLNRNCFNGIFRTNKRGQFNVPFSDRRVSPYLDLEQFRSSAKLLSRAKVHNDDFEKFCRDQVEKGDFVYLDPPYYKEGQRVFNEYNRVPFSPSDFDRLTAVLNRFDRIGAKFLLSFPSTAAVVQLSKKWNSTRHRVLRTVAGDPAKRTKQTEMLVYNYEKR
jgi:DNA adenine methylase